MFIEVEMVIRISNVFRVLFCRHHCDELYLNKLFYMKYVVLLVSKTLYPGCNAYETYHLILVRRICK